MLGRKCYFYVSLMKGCVIYALDGNKVDSIAQPYMRLKNDNTFYCETT